MDISKKETGKVSIKLLSFLIIVIIFLGISRFALSTICTERLSEADYFIGPYISELLEVTSQWDYEQLKPHMTEGFKQILTEDEFIKELDKLSNLGKLLSHDKPRLVKHKRFKNIFFGRKAINVFTVSAEYEKGRASVVFQIVDTCGTGKLNFITVNRKRKKR